MVFCECGAIGTKNEITVFTGSNDPKIHSSEDVRVVQLHFHEYGFPSINKAIDVEFDPSNFSMKLSYMSKDFHNSLMNKNAATIVIKNVLIAVSENNGDESLYNIRIEDGKNKIEFARSKEDFEKFFERVNRCCQWAEEAGS